MGHDRRRPYRDPAAGGSARGERGGSGMTGEGAMPTYIVDAFTDHRGGGHPAPVIELGSPVSEEWMRLTASDLGLPATVFVQQAGDGPAGPSLRWFTGPRELPSCGHGTLAAAHVALGRDQGLASI